MQNKGVIRLFAILFALACLYQLSFTWVTRGVESDAKDAAKGDITREKAYLDSMSTQEVYNIFVEEFTYAEVKEKEINLGLDLRGGMNVILEVSVKDILRSLANNSRHPVFVQAIANTDKAQGNSQESYLENFFLEFDKANDEGVNLSDPAIFGSKSMNDIVGFNADDDAIKEELRKQVDAAVENVYTVLRARIDQFGVVQPNIQRLENTGRILIELPGVKDPDRVKKLLQSTAELEFWNLYEGAEFLNYLNAANERLKTIVPNPREKNTADASSSEGIQEVENLDFDAVEETVAEEAMDSASSSIDSLLAGSDDEAASDSLNAFNPLFEILYPNYDFQNNQVGQGPIIGTVMVKDTGKVNRYLNMPQIRALLPSSMRYAEFVWTAKPRVEGSEALDLLAIKSNRDRTPDLAGDVVVDAGQDFDERNSPIVRMQMNASGARKWQEVTREASQQEPKRSVAVILDGLAYSYPRVQGEIAGGNTQIYGNFTIEEAQDLANILKAGKLPAPARIIQADIVGPSLGREAISAGLWSFVVAMSLVLIYMVFYYNQAGLISNVALLVNMFFIFGVLASLGAVLTLPGIAGIVLTIGMSVDANVLIYERIREELHHGKGLRLAISDGYKNALSSIIDANVTTLLTGIILYSFGTGPIRGFATTLIIGILTSLFTAIFITRLIFEWRLDGKHTVRFASKMTEGWFRNVNIDFLGKRKMAYTISGIIIALGIGSLVTRGLNYGVDFVGGRTYQVRFDQPVSTQDLAAVLGEEFVTEDGQNIVPEVKTIGSSSQVVITSKYRIDETGIEVEEEIKQKLFSACRSFFAETPDMDAFYSGTNELGLMSERQVGPTIADDIKKSAIWAVLFSLVVIFLYILIRFSRWQFSLGAVAATMHDVLIVLSIFSLGHGFLPFSMEIDQAFIAAILTVIGYSLNDTVVVFDRIREYFQTHHKRKDLIPMVNEALNQTLSRTLNTSMTTLVVMLVIFIWGGDTIRGFMFAMLIGIIVGTYSSLFVASPVMVDTMKKKIEDKPKK
jgi:SecD/SecF fusion protein